MAAGLNGHPPGGPAGELPDEPRWPDLSADQWRDLESRVRAFEAAWAAGGRPDPAGYLPPEGDPTRRPVLVELVHADLEMRLRRGEPARVEDYLERFAELRRGRALPDLVAAEYELRRRREPRLDPAEYARRFPSLTGLFAALSRREAASTATAAGGDFVLGDPAETGEGLPTVPGYELIERLGRGGMGVVYKAVDVRLNRTVAVKTVRPDAGPAAAERLRREAKAAAALQHPNVAQVHQVFAHDGRLFVVSEYLGGGSLADRTRRGPTPAPEAAAVAEPLARAVAYAHSKGVIHRDLKPQNVLLVADGVPKVADFGLARRLDADSGRVTRADIVAGSPCYLAPEQAAGAEPGPAADIYGLGAILYELLTGRPPFLGATILETLDLVRGGDPIPPRRLVPAVPKDLETVCLKCLDREPARRYPAAAAVAEDLARFLRGEPVVARPLGPLGRAARAARRKPAAAALGLTLAAALAAAAAGAAAHASRLAAVNGRLSAALGQRDRAMDAQTAALTQADAHARRAEAERVKAEAARRRAEESERTARRLLFASDLRLAAEAVRDGDPARAAELLDVRRAGSPNAVTGALAFVRNRLDRLTRCPGTPIDRLAGPAYHACVSPDGTKLAACGAAGEVRVYEVGSWRPLARWHAGQGELNGLAFGPDGATLAVAGDDGAVTLRDAASGSERWRTEAFGRQAFQVAFGLGGSVIAACGNEPRVKLLDAATGAVLADFEADADAVESVAVTPDGGTLAAAGYRGRASAWDLAGRRELWGRDPRGDDTKLLSVACSPDGRLFAFGSSKSEVVLLAAADGAEVPGAAAATARRVREGAGFSCAAFLPDSGLLAAGGVDGVVRLSEPGGRVDGHAPAARPAWVSGGGRIRHLTAAGGGLLVTASQTGDLAAWRPDVEPPIRVVAADEAGDLAWVAGVDDLPVRVVAAEKSGVRLIDPATGAAETLRAGDGPWATAVPFGGGRRVLLGSLAGRIEAWERRPGGPRPLWGRTLAPPREVTRGGAAAAAPRLAVRLTSRPAGGPPHARDHALAVLDAGSGATLAERPMPAWVCPPAVSPDGRAVAASDGPAVVLFDGDTLATRVVLRGHVDTVDCVAFSPDGRLVAGGGRDQTACLWEAATGRLIAAWRADSGDVDSVAFSPDGETLLTATAEHPPRLWDVATRRLLAEPGALPDPARLGRWRPASFSPDGTRVAVGSGPAFAVLDGGPQ